MEATPTTDKPLMVHDPLTFFSLVGERPGWWVKSKMAGPNNYVHLACDFYHRNPWDANHYRSGLHVVSEISLRETHTCIVCGRNNYVA